MKKVPQLFLALLFIGAAHVATAKESYNVPSPPSGWAIDKQELSATPEVRTILYHPNEEFEFAPLMYVARSQKLPHDTLKRIVANDGVNKKAQVEKIVFKEWPNLPVRSFQYAYGEREVIAYLEERNAFVRIGMMVETGELSPIEPQFKELIQSYYATSVEKS